jgi:hypothetical protein
MESDSPREKILENKKINQNLIRENTENLLIDIFPKSKEEVKNKSIIRRISDFNFTSLIKDEIRNSIKPFLDFNIIEKYNIYNFAVIFNDSDFNALEILSKFNNLERMKLDPVMITNSLDNSDIEFYWGEWNSYGKKEGFGIRLSSNGNFYFGIFKNDKMEGLGLFAFADKETYEEKIPINKNSRINYYYSKQYFDLEKRNKNLNNNNKSKNKNEDKDQDNGKYKKK